MVMTPELQRLQETVDVLAGRRKATAAGKQAVLVNDLAALLDIPPEPTSVSAASTPTQDEFNALVADVHFLWKRMAALAAAMQKKRS